MKKTVYLLVFFATLSVQYSFAQDSIKSDPSGILLTYYDIKNALVGGNANAASLKGEELVRIINGIDLQTINEATRTALLKDATAISKNKDIKGKRESFSTLSSNIYVLAKAVKLTTEPVYYTYCPMKKTHWLSREAAIRNPYFGSSMLTCGKVEETIKQ